MRERGATPEQVAFAYEFGGGLPPAVGWVGQRLNGAPVDLGEVERELVRWIRPMFLLWWQRLKLSQRAFLKECVGEGRAVVGLADEERRLAQGLVDAGFLREREGKFGLEGRAWSEFVRDAS